MYYTCCECLCLLCGAVLFLLLLGLCSLRPPPPLHQAPNGLDLHTTQANSQRTPFPNYRYCGESWRQVQGPRAQYQLALVPLPAVKQVP